MKHINLKINDKIEPIDRGEIYEKPLSKYLKKQNIGSISGADTCLNDIGEIECVNFDIALKADSNNLENTINQVINFLESKGIPKGSEISVDNQLIPFGNMEGMAIHFDNLNLSPEIYQSSDINFVFDTIVHLLDDKSEVLRYLQTPNETILYFYGDSFVKMIEKVKPFADTYPLFQNSHIIKITPNHNQEKL
ncbi:MAG: hypothetical protein KA479_12840 [Saprospiraceae bacterium]|nr:hypothetical protein [Saprospiraceae bacterium]